MWSACTSYINECHSLILKNGDSITDEMSNNVMKDMINIEMPWECESLLIGDVNDIIDKICVN